MDADERWDGSLWNSCVCAAAAAERRTYMDKGYKATCSIRKVVFRHVRLVLLQVPVLPSGLLNPRVFVISALIFALASSDRLRHIGITGSVPIDLLILGSFVSFSTESRRRTLGNTSN